jgi:threonine dehydratase
MAPHDPYLEKIQSARVYDVAIESPLDPAPALSRRLGCEVLLKREDLQPVFSFKLRGAFNKMSRLTDQQRSVGVVAASAGNHAQGVALAARKLGCRATIVMPVMTQEIKVSAVSALGAEVVLHGDSYDEAFQHARGLAAATGATLVHPYDDPEVIAGQGTIGLEILKQCPGRLDAVFVPIGGGGLAAGVSVCLKNLRPGVKVFGVQPADSDAMRRSIQAGKVVPLEHAGVFADGVAVRKVGEETFRLCRQYLDGVITVSLDDICAAIKDVFEDTRSILEPAGALSVAGLKSHAESGAAGGQTLVAVTSGANVNFERLRFVAERAEVGERREAIIAVTIPERPGSFRSFCRLLGPRNVTEFNYRYADPQEAHVFVSLRVAGRAEAEAVVETLRRSGIAAADLTDNEMAKLHVRHLVGGRAGGLPNERLFRFEFPERPGALMRFLDNMNEAWNITLFHYRNLGADYGSVLAGIQVPPESREAFERFLSEIRYDHEEETGNPAAVLFLS